jgi:glycosyltransferase involved in cell wall biosynthesis/2-polyprenyl-3-methyl-5-hydroxy-6-metoxy-1,4-benzoquinol methylase
MNSSAFDSVEGSNKARWTAEAAETFWKTCYFQDLEAARWPSSAAELIAAVLARRFLGRILLVGDRDPGMAEALLKAGYSVARADIGPWLRPSAVVETHGRWLGSVPSITESTYDIVLTVGLLECLRQDEVRPFLEAVRNAVGTGGHVVVAVPNDERIEQNQVACPKTGTVFHCAQRLRAFNRSSLRALFAGVALEITSELEIELEERVLLEHAERDPEFALASHVFVGAGTTLLAIAQSAARVGRSNTAGLRKANRWLEARRESAARVSTPKPENWIWTNSNVLTYWSRIAGTALDDLSFGKVLGQVLLRGIEPWLVPGGRHLDVGAGEGHMAEILAASNYPVAALEPAEERARKIKAKLTGDAAFLGQLDCLDNTHRGSFDVVIACEVIEHVLDEDLEEFFGTLTAALKPGGRIILSTPNSEDLGRSIIYSPFGNVLFHRWQHVRRLSAIDIDVLLRRHGFETEALHEVDLATAQHEDLPSLEEILGSSRSRRHGNARNLIAIAHRIGDSVASPRQLSNFERRIAKPARPARSASPVMLAPGKRVYETFELAVTTAIPIGLNSFRLELPGYLAVGDDEECADRSMLRLFEDGRELGPAHAVHADVARLGRGRFSHWQRNLFFSSSDDQDPRHNGRRYVAVAEAAPVRTANLDERLRAGDVSMLVWELSSDAMQLVEGQRCKVELPRTFPAGDNGDHPTRSVLELFEDGVALGPAHALHDEIGSLGGGRFSHWQRNLFFSSSDGQDPRHNGRRYVAVTPLSLKESNLKRLARGAVRSTVRGALPWARAVLPHSIKIRLSRQALEIENVLARRYKQSFYSRPCSLNDFQPAFLRSTFANGPVVLCNNALAWGGVERQVVNTLRGLAERLGSPPHLLCVRLGYSSDYDFYKTALADFPGEVRNTVDLNKSRRYLARTSPGLERRMSEATAWLPIDVQEEILRFAGDFAQLKPSVVHVWQDALSISAGIAARMIGVPRIIVSSRNMAAKRFAYHRPYMADGYREIARCADIVMLNNSEAGARDYAEWLGLPVDRYRIIRNGIDAAEISRPPEEEVREFRSRLGLTKGSLVVGSIFRFYPEKRPLLWIETAARIAAERPDCQFVIFGTGPMKDEMLASARSNGFADRLHMPGTVMSAALGLSIMDLFLLTSELEGTPNALLEASLIGVPVVASDAGGTRETIGEGVTGFVTDSAEPDHLARKAISALADSVWRCRAREAGPKFVQERFGIERMLAETLELYEFNKR